MFPVTADSGECLPRQTMRLCSSEPLPTPCLCVRIGNISLLPRAREWAKEKEKGEEREREREAVTTPLARNSFLPCLIQSIAFFVLRGMPLVRSNARVWRIIVRQILARSFCVARLSETGYVPRVAPEQFADIGSYSYAFNSGTRTRNGYIQLTSIFPLYAEYREIHSLCKENSIDPRWFAARDNKKYIFKLQPR